MLSASGDGSEGKKKWGKMFFVVMCDSKWRLSVIHTRLLRQGHRLHAKYEGLQDGVSSAKSAASGHHHRHQGTKDRGVF